MVQVTGILHGPTGQPVEDAKLRITVEHAVGSLKGACTELDLGSTGTYDFPLTEGTYLIQLLQGNEWSEPKIVEVKVDTPSPSILSALPEGNFQLDSNLSMEVLAAIHDAILVAAPGIVDTAVLQEDIPSQIDQAVNGLSIPSTVAQQIANIDIASVVANEVVAVNIPSQVTNAVQGMNIGATIDSAIERADIPQEVALAIEQSNIDGKIAAALAQEVPSFQTKINAAMLQHKAALHPGA